VSEDVVEQTIEARRRVGDVAIFDPSGTLSGWRELVGWNPLDHVTTWDDAKQIAHAMVTAGSRRIGIDTPEFWHEAAKKLLATHLLAATAQSRKLTDVFRWISTQEEFEVRSLLQSIGNETALLAAEASWQREDRARSSIYTTVETVLDAWERDRILRAADTDPRFKLQKFLDGDSNTLYLCSPVTAQNEYSPVIATFTRVLLSEIYSRNSGFAFNHLGLHGPLAALESSPSRVTPLLLVLDDAGNVTKLPDLGDIASTAAKSAIQLLTIFQNISQMEGLYGESESRTILDNHSALLILPGSSDMRTLKFTARLLANPESQLEQSQCLNVGSIRQLATGSAICIYENLPPLRLELRSSLSDNDLLSLQAGRDEGSNSDQ
jgi:type IV secretory pathway TraG/TraD family ATPase VirD4